MAKSYLVLDLETVPDARWAPADDAKDKMAPACFQEVIVAGCAAFDETLKLTKAGPVENKKGERALLVDLLGWIDKHRPTLITWWGRGFDVPVLEARALAHGVTARWLGDRDYSYRYSNDKHLDLCDVLGHYGMSKGNKLDYFAKLVGAPGKFGFDGSMVAEAYEQGRYEEITHYCMTDVFQTALVWLRFRLMTGQTALVDFQRAGGGLLDHINSMDDYEDFLKKIDENQFLLPTLTP